MWVFIKGEGEDRKKEEKKKKKDPTHTFTVNIYITSIVMILLRLVDKQFEWQDTHKLNKNKVKINKV